jgi:EthD domain
MGPKIVYLAERNPALDAAAWADRWREHGELNRSLPSWSHIWRYEQNRTIPIPELVAARVPGARREESCGGVGEVFYRSHKARSEMRKEPYREQIRADEVETFGRTVDHFAMTTCEQTRREVEGTGVKLVVFLLGAGDRGRDQFWRSWRACIASPPLEPPWDAASAYVESPALEPARRWPATASEDEDLPDYDGVVEIGFRDRDALIAAIDRSDVASALERAGEELDRSLSTTVLVEQTVLYDELERRDWTYGELLALRRRQRGAGA